MLKLGQILETNLAAEYRARISDLRRDRHEITCTINAKVPSENIYMLVTNKTPPKKGSSKQHFNDPCPMCKSYYRYGNICNDCGFKFKGEPNALKTT